MHYTDIDLAAAKEGLMMAGVAQLLTALKDTEDAQTIREAIPAFAAELKPMLQGLKTFLVQGDIDALKQFEAAGIERHYAVALLTRQRVDLSSFTKIINNTITSKKKQ